MTEGLSIETRKPDWLRPKVHHGPEVLELKKTIRSLDLATVCEDAGCPNLSECWSDGTATFMVLGERCTRACGFCLVDTNKPLAPCKAVLAHLGLDRYFQAAAEAARRAVLNVNCQPLQLPPDKYEIWKEIRFNFDPSKMLS